MALSKEQIEKYANDFNQGVIPEDQEEERKLFLHGGDDDLEYMTAAEMIIRGDASMDQALANGFSPKEVNTSIQNYNNNRARKRMEDAIDHVENAVKKRMEADEIARKAEQQSSAIYPVTIDRFLFKDKTEFVTAEKYKEITGEPPTIVQNDVDYRDPEAVQAAYTQEERFKYKGFFGGEKLLTAAEYFEEKGEFPEGVTQEQMQRSYMILRAMEASETYQKAVELRTSADKDIKAANTISIEAIEMLDDNILVTDRKSYDTVPVDKETMDSNPDRYREVTSSDRDVQEELTRIRSEQGIARSANNLQEMLADSGLNLDDPAVKQNIAYMNNDNPAVQLLGLKELSQIAARAGNPELQEELLRKAVTIGEQNPDANPVIYYQASRDLEIVTNGDYKNPVAEPEAQKAARQAANMGRSIGAYNEAVTENNKAIDEKVGKLDEVIKAEDNAIQERGDKLGLTPGSKEYGQICAKAGAAILMAKELDIPEFDASKGIIMKIDGAYVHSRLVRGDDGANRWQHSAISPNEIQNNVDGAADALSQTNRLIADMRSEKSPNFVNNFLEKTPLAGNVTTQAMEQALAAKQELESLRRSTLSQEDPSMRVATSMTLN